MRYVIKKVGISMMSGAACAVGSWIAKHLLKECDKALVKQRKDQKELDPA